MKAIMDVLRGVAIGVANIIPGVSGGTMAVSMGVYDKIIGAVSGGYWLVVVAVFLYYTYGPKGNGNGQHSWFIWAIAGVLFAAIMLVLKTVKRSGKKD